MSSGPYIHLCGLLASLGIPGLKWPASKGAITIDCSAAVAWARISFLATILYIYIYIYTVFSLEASAEGAIGVEGTSAGAVASARKGL